MPNVQTLRQKILDGCYDRRLAALYGWDRVEGQRRRYIQAVDDFLAAFPMNAQEKGDIRIFSSPGRTELGGNHTDHNHGRVLAGSVNLDMIAVAAPSEDGCIAVQSDGYAMDRVEVTDSAVHPDEKNRSAALVRGVAAGLQERGYAVGGMKAYVTSAIPTGSGLSSSAAYEVLIGMMLNTFYHAQAISPVVLAQTAQFAENVYFGKPSGLMDQMACSIGGAVAMDFQNPCYPVAEQIPLDTEKNGFVLNLVDISGSHADLTEEYAAVTREMGQVAECLGVSHLRDSSLDRFLPEMPRLRQVCGDRAVLRAFHFFQEDKRVEEETKALQRGDFSTYLKLVTLSGHSSFEYLQNVYVASKTSMQGASIGLCLAQMLLQGQGAYRIHGGGFGGTIQAYVPAGMQERFQQQMETVFGAGSCKQLSIRPFGVVCVDTMKD